MIQNPPWACFAPVLGVAEKLAPPEPTVVHWLLFAGLVVVLLAIDLIVFHRQSREPSLRESAMWTAVWCLLALAFNAFLWAWRGPEIGIAFLTGYLLEWTLSMDNVFVFAVIFNFFRVPLKYQYRVLFWGILGAIIMRLSFVLAGTALIKSYEWILVGFGAFLVYTAIKLAVSGDNEVDPEKNPLFRIARRFFPVSKLHHGDHFVVREEGKLCITPLFIVLLVIESTDVAFAVDSVPAIFGVTKDSFTVFTSNIFAILGLRALYFLLAGVMDLFRYLKYGLSAVLAFIGIKMVIAYLLPHWIEAIPHEHVVSLVVIVSLLAISIFASLFAKRREDSAGETPDLPAGETQGGSSPTEAQTP